MSRETGRSPISEPAAFRTFVPPKGHPRYEGLDADIVTYSDAMIDRLEETGMFTDVVESIDAPYVGVTTDGIPEPGLFPLQDEGAPTPAMVMAAQNVLANLDAKQLEKVGYPLASDNWRKWFNPEIYFFRHGLRLDEEPQKTRDDVMALVRACLSEEGYEKAVDCMFMNSFLGDVMGAPKIMNAFSYNFSIFGEPSETTPWGWQLTGHHLVLNCLVVGRQMAMSPLFFGAEPNEVDEGPRSGLKVLTIEEAVGLRLMDALTPELIEKAVLFDDPYALEVPDGRVVPGDHLHLCGIAHDNRVIPYEGVQVSEFDAVQRELVLGIVDAYSRHLPDGPSAAARKASEDHLDETWFCWIGGHGPDDPFYWRLQSPVKIFEFDHHAGIFLTNEHAMKFHIHTLVRTPNGNDYGMELIGQYHERNGE